MVCVNAKNTTDGLKSFIIFIAVYLSPVESDLNRILTAGVHNVKVKIKPTIEANKVKYITLIERLVLSSSTLTEETAGIATCAKP